MALSRGEKYAIKKRFKDEYDAYNWWTSNNSIDAHHLLKTQLKLFEDD